MPKCPYCPRTFHRISSCQSHSSFCAILHQGKYAQEASLGELDDLPSTQEMYKVLQALVKDGVRMKAEITELKKAAKREKKKVCLVDWLNNNRTPQADFNSWVSQIEVTERDFNYLVSTTFVEGALMVLKRELSEQRDESYPICCFDQKLKIFFIFLSDGWRMIDDDEFSRFIASLQRKFGKIFQKWIKDNTESIARDDEKFHTYTKQLYFADFDASVKKIERKLYNCTKYNLTRIVEYEFTF